MTEAYIPHPKQLTRCRGCRRTVFFATTQGDKKIPIDEKPANDGNLLVATSGTQLPTATVMRSGQAAGMREQGVPTYKAHFATCPNADDFRKKARARR